MESRSVGCKGNVGCEEGVVRWGMGSSLDFSTGAAGAGRWSRAAWAASGKDGGADGATSEHKDVLLSRRIGYIGLHGNELQRWPAAAGPSWV